VAVNLPTGIKGDAMDKVKLALELNKIVHNECKEVPHDIGLRLAEKATEIVGQIEPQVMPKIAGIEEIRSNPDTNFLLSCMRVNKEVPENEVWVFYKGGKAQKFRIL
jgi:hypothetical protein